MTPSLFIHAKHLAHLHSNSKLFKLADLELIILKVQPVVQPARLEDKDKNAASHFVVMTCSRRRAPIKGFATLNRALIVPI